MRGRFFYTGHMKNILENLKNTETKFLETKPLALWLLTCCVMIVMMIVIGAITRLTESGLSIVDWHGFKDMVPPLNDAAWHETFAKYQDSPEYILKNKGMEMEAFKHIYFWEWLHRLWGRLIGFVYLLPLIYFWARGRIPPVMKPRFLAFLALGGLQGFVGWYMVKSGLVNEPRVSHFRLAAHLSLALLLLAVLWWHALLLLPRFRDKLASFDFNIGFCIKRHYVIGFVLLLGTICWGAFTAGLDAGLACSDFPKTCAQWLPQELFFQGKFWTNILHEPTAVQFTHRVWGTLTFLMLFTLGIRLIRTRQAQLRRLGLHLHVLILFQWLLGIGTVHSHVAVPVAALHQTGAVLSFLVMITFGLFVAYTPRRAP